MEKLLYKLKPAAVSSVGAALVFYAPPFFAESLCFPAAALFILLSALSFFEKNLPRRVKYTRLLAAFFTFGVSIGGFSRIAAENDALVFYGQDRTRAVSISGTLLDDPRTSRNGRGMGTLYMRKLSTRNGIKTSASGKVLTLFPDGSIPQVKDFGRGSEISVDGGFSEDGKLFIAKGLFITRPPSALNSWRTGIRIACVKLFSPYEWGGLALALLIGIRDNLAGEFSRQYQDAGLSYILALSGMHLAIISGLIAFVLRRPLGIKAAFAAGSVLIIVYVFIVGAQPSLERAAFMYVIAAFAVILSLPKDPLNILSLSFLLQIVLNPQSGLSVSFILSYSALAGILVLSVPLEELFRGFIPKLILSPLSASLAAFCATIAITAGFFSMLRPIGILCGLVMVPLTTFFMIGAIAFPFISFIPPLKTLASIILSLLYSILDKISALGAAFPGVELSMLSGIALNAALLCAIAAAHKVITDKRKFS